MKNYRMFLHAQNDLQNALKLTYDRMKEGHPGLYDYILFEELDPAYDAAAAIDRPMTSDGFFKVFQPFVRTIQGQPCAPDPPVPGRRPPL